MHARAGVCVVEIAEILEQAGRHELPHPVAGEPEHDVGRRARQPAADRFLVALVVVDVELDPEVGILALEAIDDRLPRGSRRRVGIVRIDDEQARAGGRVADGEQGEATDEAR